MTYYSRFYIQEMCFAFLSARIPGLLVAVPRPAGRQGGSLFAGVFAGLMAATKETAVIVFAAAALGVAAVLTRERLIAPKSDTPIRRQLFRPALHHSPHRRGGRRGRLLFLLRVSSGRDQGRRRRLKIYVEKGAPPRGSTAIRFFLLSRDPGRLPPPGGLVWTELLVLLLGAAGMVFVFLPHRRSFLDEIPDPLPVDRSLGLFLVVYTLAATLAFSLLGYKTPWNMIPFYLGWLIFAGIGGITLFRMMKTLPLRAASSWSWRPVWAISPDKAAWPVRLRPIPAILTSTPRPAPIS